jgi:hypothetical protein
MSTVTRVDHVSWGADGGRAAPRVGRLLLAVALCCLLVLGSAAGAVVVADARLQEARRDDVRRVGSGLQAGDCAVVAAAYGSATTGLILPLRRRPAVPPDAVKAAADCREVRRADELVAGGRPLDGLSAYLEFRRSHVFSPLDAPVRGRVQDVVREGGLKPGMVACRLVGRAVDPRTTRPVEADPELLTPCGELLLRTDDTTGNDSSLAMIMFEQVREKYPRSPEAVRAETVQAGYYFRHAHNERRDWEPTRLSSAAGPAKLTMANLTRYPMTFVVSGPSGGRIVEIPPCKGCPTLDEDDDGGACRKAHAPDATISLPPGTYKIATLLSGGWSFYDTWKLRGGRYHTCILHSR